MGRETLARIGDNSGAFAPPILIEHDGVMVARDDLIGGGTKARFLVDLFKDADEIVYASPCEGGAQSALAWAAQACGKKATIFVAKRAKPHPRSVLAKSFGATVYQVKCGYLNVVQKRARDYCDATGAHMAPFGMNTPAALEAIASAARSTGFEPAEVWSAGGSGVLTRALALAFPNAKRHVVQVGRDLSAADVAGATIHKHPLPFGKTCKARPPFPSDPHYDAKAWEICAQKKGAGPVLFWNVTGPA